VHCGRGRGAVGWGKVEVVRCGTGGEGERFWCVLTIWVFFIKKKISILAFLKDAQRRTTFSLFLLFLGERDKSRDTPYTPAYIVENGFLLEFHFHFILRPVVRLGEKEKQV